MAGNWTFTETDQALLEKIQDFIPEKVFDAHAHLWQLKDCSIPEKDEMAKGPKNATIEIWQEFVGHLVGKSRLKGGLFLGFPMCDIDKTNDFLISQLKNNTFCKGEILVSPDYPQEKLLEYINLPFISGLKPYYTFGSEKPTFDSSIKGFAPEWMWELADRYNLVITLHIVKHKALADPENQQKIRELMEKYPNAKLILAHAARGFHSTNTISGISSLRGLENVFFDLSAVTESASIVAILEEFGPQKILWGSDFGIFDFRGKAVFAKALGNGHPMAAVIGTSEAMEGAHKSFISSTYWTESVGPAAALATIKKMSESNVPSHVEKIGLQVKEYWRKYGNRYNLPVKIDMAYPCLAHFSFEGSLSNELRTLYTQLMLKEGFLAAIMIYPTLAHTEEIVEKYGEAIERVFYKISETLKKEDVTEQLKGPVAHTGFARLT